MLSIIDPLKISVKIFHRLFVSPFNFLGIILLVIISIISFSSFTIGIEDKLPPLQTYPLPSSLENWSTSNPDNYFEQIEPHAVGYLIWSDFPIKVYLQSPDDNLSPSARLKFSKWQEAAKIAIATWNSYLPMTEVESVEAADILIYRRSPQLKAEINPETGLYNLPRVKAATTSIKFYFTDTQPAQLKHRMTIEVNPRQTFEYLVSNITHELGHALGIWGHSLNPQDVMYYSHTKEIPSLSERDINTLKQIYQQPTRLSGIRTQ